jgi:menaquinone-dependent protoporphyrinogen IX oxidase
MQTKPVLVAYTTNSGSTESVAQAVAEELGKTGATVEVRRLEEVASLEPYAAVVVGAPMILGWHRAARSFVKTHQQVLSSLPVAYFFTAMSLTQTGETTVQGIPVLVDTRLAKPPRKVGRLSFRERYATVARYLGPVLADAPLVKPLSVAFFGGKLELFRLKLLQMIFVMLIIRAEPGDLRNWPAIREWAAGLQTGLQAGLIQNDPV